MWHALMFYSELFYILFPFILFFYRNGETAWLQVYVYFATLFFSMCIGMNGGLNPSAPYVLGAQDPYTVGIQIAGQVMCN